MRTVSLLLALTLVFQNIDMADGQTSADQQLKFFEAKIRPVLVRECYSCHSEQAGQKKGGLWLDTKTRTEIGGDSGPAVIAGDAESSLLFNAINHDDYVMPPGKKLPSHQIADFKKWIESGAYDPREKHIESVESTVTDADIEAGRNFWSFVPPKSSAVPKFADSQWPASAIDHFVEAKLREYQLSPPADATPETLLRRLTVDLTGIIPTPSEVKQFVDAYRQNSERAVSDAVDRLLNCDSFGERWGRHWLDVARYAESTGRELNATYPNAWRYRDYVIESFNNDKPYDRFIQEQVAGDLLPAANDEVWAQQLIATGFLAVGPKSLTERNARQFQLDLVDEQIDVTTRVVLGISVACARCHDHKFDPIPQQDYYAMAGIFESTKTLYGTVDMPQNRRPSSHIILPIDEPGPNAKSLSAQSRNDIQNKIAQLKQQIAELQRKRREARRNGNSQTATGNGLALLRRKAATLAALESELASVNAQGQPLSFCMGVQDKTEPQNAHLLVRGEFDQPVRTVPRGFIQVIDHSKTSIDGKTSGRRQLAEWLTRPSNPLTARVMVNRIWLHMFGQGLVRTPENFGATGMRPTHPELLDYLAVEFMENGWSVKHIVGLITKSRTYRMSSKFDVQAFAKDPENRLYWRANQRQLDAESLRDSILLTSGNLIGSSPHGSSVAMAGLTIARDGKLPHLRNRAAAMADTLIRNSSTDPIANYRSVYLPIVRDQLPRALELFDFAEPSMVIGQRDCSVTPTQGLYLFNNPFVIQQSKDMAQRIMKEAATLSGRIDRAFWLAYGRAANSQELASATEFYHSYPTIKRRLDPPDATQLRKLTAITHALLASAEFRYID